MYRALGNSSLGGLFEIDLTEIAENLARATLRRLKPELLGMVKQATNKAIDEVKPRIPELMKDVVPAAINEFRPRIPYIVDSFLPQVPVLVRAAEKPVESFLRDRLYPNTIRPLIDQELKKVSVKAEDKITRAAVGTGSIAVAAILAYAILSRRKQAV